MATAEEEWRAAPGWDGLYEVSSLGRVRSLDREVEIPASWYREAHIRRCKGKVLAASFDTFGYPMVKLKHAGNERCELHRIHSLVAEAFLGPRPEGHVVAHNDGNPRHSAKTNLRYDTIAGNFSDKLSHGTYTCGERHSRARLSQEQVEAIRQARGPQTDIADRFGICQQHVSNLRSGKRWKA